MKPVQNSIDIDRPAPLVWLAPEEPIVALPEVPEHDDDVFVNCPLGPA